MTITTAQMSLIEKLAGSKSVALDEIGKTVKNRTGYECGHTQVKKYATREDASETIKRLQSK